MRDKLSVKIVGSFATEYSIAKSNRYLARALDHRDDVSESILWADKCIADKLPTKQEYKKYSFLEKLYIPQDKQTDVAVLSNFPKNSMSEFGTRFLNGKLKLVYLAWEESLFPANWVKEFNDNLHGVVTTSKHVADVLKKSGLSLPVCVIGNTYNRYKDAKEKYYNLHSNKKFKFLHISSAHYRKGIDVLLRAYVNEFTNKDNVSLILKIYTNADSVIHKELDAVKKLRSQDDMPEIILIDNPETTDGEMLSLWNQANAFVVPTRGEGFGMPMAEALMMGKPLITTAYSGHMDFCNDSNSFLVDYKMVESKSHLNIPGAMVAEPNIVELQKHMRFVFENADSEEVKSRIENGYKTVKDFSWDNVADRLMNFSKSLMTSVELKRKSIAIISTINSKCGLAEYTNDLYVPIKCSFKSFNIIANADVIDRLADDQEFVFRTWKYGDSNMGKTIDLIDKLNPNYLHIQYHTSKFSYNGLTQLINFATEKNIRTFLTLHNFDDGILEINNILAKCDKIIVHSLKDFEMLQGSGLNNVTVLKIGVNVWGNVGKDLIRKAIGISGDPIIGAHGLIHDKKGFVELIQSMPHIKKDYMNAKLLMTTALTINNSTAKKTYQLMLKKVKELNLQDSVYIITDYLSEIEIIRTLQASDIVVLPYSSLNEGASGAINRCFAACKPVIITQSKIFSDLQTAGFRINDNKPETIAKGIIDLLKNKNLYKEEVKKSIAYAENNSWGHKQIEMLSILISQT